MGYFRVRIVTKGSAGLLTRVKEYSSYILAEAHCRKVRTRSYTKVAEVEEWAPPARKWVNERSREVSPYENWSEPFGTYLPSTLLRPPSWVKKAKVGSAFDRTAQNVPFSVEESVSMDLSLELSHNGILAS